MMRVLRRSAEVKSLIALSQVRVCDVVAGAEVINRALPTVEEVARALERLDFKGEVK